MTRARTLAAALCFAVAVSGVACSSDDGETAPQASSAEIGDVLEVLADEVVIPSYETLVTALGDLADDIDALCNEPSAAALETARDAWRAVATAWRGTRASGVGPAMDRRLAASLGFLARPTAVDALLDGTDPIDAASLAEAGAAVKGISALEIALFGPGSDRLAEGDPRRCAYLAGVTQLASDEAIAVLDDWTSGYRETFVAGMDGDPQSSVDAIVNEIIFRVTDTDDQGLRSLVEATTLEELSANRTDGPAAHHAAELEAGLTGATALLGENVDDGRLLALVAARSSDTATRLQEAAAAATAAMGALPDSVSAAFEDPVALAEAQRTVAALKVLLATEVASELGVTISFSDADGDS